MIRCDPTLVYLTSNFSVLCTNVKFIYIITHSGWNLAWIFMKERVKSTKMTLKPSDILYPIYPKHSDTITPYLFVFWVIFHGFVVDCWLFSKLTFSKNSFKNNIRVSNRLDPHQDWHSVSPDLGPNCLKIISRRHWLAGRVNTFFS